MNDNCSICNGFITAEHGGLVCNNCGSLSCISDHCSPTEFVNGDSITIPYCLKCKPNKTLQDLKKGIDFILERKSNESFISGLYWSLAWFDRLKDKKDFRKSIESKIEKFKQPGALSDYKNYENT